MRADTFDVAVVGAGHAGVEAAAAAARLGARVILVTADPAAAGRMSCNPAIGGLGKGHIVREIDALGGVMGRVADATGIQFRRLNTRKGAAVRGTRCQSDRRRYAAAIRRVVAETPGLVLARGAVAAPIVAGGRAAGIALEDGSEIRARATVVTTGTFLGGALHVGDRVTPGGRHGEPPSTRLAAALAALGLRLGRLKTGTPCRLDAATIDYGRLEPQPGSDPPPRFSCLSDWPNGRPPLPQRDCHITYTNPAVHDLIRAHLHRSPIYSGAIDAPGPRYCPSIEDKVVRFADRPRHQVFLEPEGLDSPLVYPNGISTSLPADVQERMVRGIAGLERARIVRLGYAVAYDYVDPTQLRATLEVRELAGLFFAGQINGTTGYEEAAGQGLLAGANAALAARGAPPLVLRRDQAYIGVMVDDLVTRGVDEPYRMFTARAEHRLLLREDNAGARLTPLGRRLGLVGETQWRRFQAQAEEEARLTAALTAARVPAGAEAAARLAREGGGTAAPGTPLETLLRRPAVTIDLLVRAGLLPGDIAGPAAREAVEIATKYAPYLDRQRARAARARAAESVPLPAALDYADIVGLSSEAREKLAARRPASLGQAARIPGITPAALAAIEVHLRVRAAG